jgi:hypothetical protein
MLGMKEGSDADPQAETWFHRGMLAMGLVLETQARIYEDTRGSTLDELHNSTVSSALRATLHSARIADEVESTYDRLVERRRASEGQTEVMRPPPQSSISPDADSWPGASRLGTVLPVLHDAVSRTAASSVPAGPPPGQLSFDSAFSQLGEDNSRELAARQRERARAIERGEYRTSWGRRRRGQSTADPG